MVFGENVPYRIETERTIIRCWDPRDAELFQAAVSASVSSLLPWMPWAKGEPRDHSTKVPLLRRFRGEFDLGNDFVYGVFTKDQAEVLGGCGLHTRAGAYALEVGYWIKPSYQNRGYATEVTKALVKTAFELGGVEAVQIQCDVKNAASLRVIEKVGFTAEGVLHRRQKNADDEFQDLRIASLLREEYAGSSVRRERIACFDAADREIALDSAAVRGETA